MVSVRWIFLIVASLIAAFSHPVYLSVTDLKYNEEEKRLQGTVKMFTNDLENALLKTRGKSPNLLRYKDTVAILQNLQTYLDKRLAISVNNQPVKLQILGLENEEEATWIYVQGNCEKPADVKIRNVLLYDFLPEQLNIVHVQVNGAQKSSKVNNPDEWIFLNF